MWRSNQITWKKLELIWRTWITSPVQILVNDEKKFSLVKESLLGDIPRFPAKYKTIAVPLDSSHVRIE